MRYFIFFFVFLLAAPAYAQEKQAGTGMKHIIITQPPAEEVRTQKVTEPAPEQVEKKQTASSAPPASAEKEEPVKKSDYFVPLEKVSPWAMLDEALSDNKEQQQIALNAAEKDMGIAPPIGLLFISKILASQNRVDDAALYFFMAQLRAQFDAKRLNRRTPDVAFVQSSQDIGSQITKWLLGDKARVRKLIDRIAVTEAQTVYAYDPGFNAQEPLPMEEWEKERAKVENDVLLMLQSLAAAPE